MGNALAVVAVVLFCSYLCSPGIYFTSVASMGSGKERQLNIQLTAQIKRKAHHVLVVVFVLCVFHKCSIEANGHTFALFLLGNAPNKKPT